MDEDEYEIVHDKILSMMQDFYDQIDNAVTMASYKI